MARRAVGDSLVDRPRVPVVSSEVDPKFFNVPVALEAATDSALERLKSRRLRGIKLSTRRSGQDLTNVAKIKLKDGGIFSVRDVPESEHRDETNVQLVEFINALVTSKAKLTVAQTTPELWPEQEQRFTSFSISARGDKPLNLFGLAIVSKKHHTELDTDDQEQPMLGPFLQELRELSIGITHDADSESGFGVTVGATDIYGDPVIAVPLDINQALYLSALMTSVITLVPDQLEPVDTAPQAS